MEIMKKIVKNHQLYFNAIIQFSNLDNIPSNSDSK